ncbi:MAG: universal stress protein [Phenylobacterium sp.]|uniref:universal stress protein n=1 Tax=Phenylobacterium sp. TaxID=1871053 RepID=UPI00272678E0|nr:universal stress protein [Phenylobacterium sp.]MDO9430001.1 universal stress protein [Phenylobacterium sp.]
MSYRDILVVMDQAESGAMRARLGADLASRWNARLSGLFPTSDFLLQFGAAEALTGLSPADIDRILRDHVKAVEDASEIARTNFEAAAGEAGVASDWMTVNGDHDDALVACARRTDLTIMPNRMVIHMGQRRVDAANVGVACGGPVLITPHDDYAPPIGKRVLIAWNGSREASRALRDGWPFIETAEEVHVLIVSPHGEGGPDGVLQRLLERHGIEANLIVDPSEDESAADVIERQMAEFDVDLLIMGLYGRSRLRELVLGGVSRQLLKDMPAPILMSH